MDAVIVHFNTPEITTATVKSIWKHAPGCRVFIFDNSTERPFPAMDGVLIIDNTRGQLIDFEAFLAEYPDKQPSGNEWGSAKHSKTIDFLWDLFPNGFVLLDSDILLKRDFSDIVDPGSAFVGEVYQDLSNLFHMIPRVRPFLCWLNVPMCRKAGIRYFDGDRNWRLKSGGIETLYDTGASFYEDCLNKRLPRRQIDLSDYIEHFGAGSWGNQQAAAKVWLTIHKDLYE